MSTPSPTSAAFLIRQARQRAGLTQKELAEKLDVNERSVYNYENGISFPRAEIIFALCEILGLKPRDLFNAD